MARSQFIICLTALALFTACLDDEETTNQAHNQFNNRAETADSIDYDLLRADLRQRLDTLGVGPVEAPTDIDDGLANLGHQLFFDPILSGGKDVNCASCHFMDEGTSDRRPLSIGTGAVIDEFGIERPGPQLSLTSRNSIDLFHRGSEDLRVRFWDGRIERLDDGRIVMHERSYSQIEGTYLRVVVDEAQDLLAGQVMFPPLNRNEMRGIHGSLDIHQDQNDLALIPDHDLEGMWRRLIRRIVDIEEYAQALRDIYPDIATEDLHFAHAANALSTFISAEFSPDDSPWDQFLRGDDQALDDAQLRGADLFYGKANCAACHGDTLMTDQRLYNLAVPPMTRGPDPLMNMDLGAAHRSHAGPDQEFHFRTPPLRNVAITEPYMHNGSLPTLERVLRHKMDPIHGLWNFDDSHLDQIFYEQVHVNPDNLARVEATYSPKADLVPKLDDHQIADLIAFMESLTSPSSVDRRDLNLAAVPSGLPVPQTSPDQQE